MWKKSRFGGVVFLSTPKIALLDRIGEEAGPRIKILKKLIEKIDQVPRLYLATLLFGLAFVQYAGAFGHAYCFDDQIVITSNENVQAGWAGIPDLWVKRKSQRLEDQYGYRPITLSSFAIDIALFGNSPGAAHVMSALYYALLCMIAFLVLRYLFPKQRQLLPFLAVLIFAVHPLHVEVVANIKSRDDIFALLFGLLSLYCFVAYFRTGGWWRLLLSAGLLLIAYFSKESAITFLAVLPMAALLDAPEKWKRRALVMGASVAGMALGLFLLTQIVSSKTVDRMDLTENSGIYLENKIMGNGLFAPHTYSERVATGSTIALRYMKDFFFPHQLKYYHGFNVVPVVGPGNPFALLSALLHLGLLFLAIRSIRRHPVVAFGIFFYFITISPYLHILRPLDDAMANRFFFTTSLGICLLLAYGLLYLLGALRTDTEADPPTGLAQPQLALPVFGGVAVLLFVLSFSRSQVWKDNMTLFSNDIRYLDDCARCHFHYANELTGIYHTSANKDEIRKKIEHHFKRAIEITPEAYNSYISLGRASFVWGDFESGMQVLGKAIEKWPERGRPYFHAGYGLYLQKQYASAAGMFRDALRLAPNRDDTNFFLAWSLFQQSQFEEALDIMQKGKQRWPTNYGFHESLSDMQFALGDHDTALAGLRELIRIAPKYPNGYEKIVYRYEQLNDAENAQRYRQMAVQNGAVR